MWEELVCTHWTLLFVSEFAFDSCGPSLTHRHTHTHALTAGFKSELCALREHELWICGGRDPLQICPFDIVTELFIISTITSTVAVDSRKVKEEYGWMENRREKQDEMKPNRN